MDLKSETSFIDWRHDDTHNIIRYYGQWELFLTDCKSID